MRVREISATGQASLDDACLVVLDFGESIAATHNGRGAGLARRLVSKSRFVAGVTEGEVMRARAFRDKYGLRRVMVPAVLWQPMPKRFMDGTKEDIVLRQLALQFKEVVLDLFGDDASVSVMLARTGPGARDEHNFLSDLLYLVEHDRFPELLPPPPLVPLRLGSKGECVIKLYECLEAHGFEANHPRTFPAHDEFTQDTLDLVRAFQRARGLTDNGLVSSEMWEYLLTPVAPPKELPSGIAVRADSGYYLIKGRKRFKFATKRAFDTWGMEYVYAREQDVQRLAHGGVLGFRDGTIVRHGGEHYIVSENKYRPLSDQALESLRGKTIIPINNQEFKLHEGGTEI